MLRLYGLNAACIIRLEHDACTIRRIDEGKSLPVALQVAEFIDERDLIHTQECRNGRYIFFCQAYVAFPSAACPTPLAGVAESLVVKV